MAYLWLAIGLVILTVGAEVLVRGASSLARAFGIPSLIIGLTVVAFGTSAPELAVSIKAGWMGQADIALGNVVGSNTFNVLFILGISAMITPLVASKQLVRLDVPVMILVSLLTLGLAADHEITRIEGVLLFAGLIGYTTWLIIIGRRQSAQNPMEVKVEGVVDETTPANPIVSGVLVLVGLALLVLGARWMVEAAISLAQAWGVSDLLIGLTIVAAGTSMPEVATSIVASIRGQRDIAIGNVVGSNIFNLLGVLGATALIAPKGVSVSDAVRGFDLPVMIAIALACLPIFITGGRISRSEGVVFFAYYIVYVLYLVLDATEHEALHPFSRTMLIFVIPITVLGIAVSVYFAIRKRGVAGGTPNAG